MEKLRQKKMEKLSICFAVQGWTGREKAIYQLTLQGPDVVFAIIMTDQSKKTSGVKQGEYTIKPE